jgi:predicted HTH transcriptional regulator
MGNLRDGGYVIVGIDDDRMEAMQPGLSDEQAESWRYDDVARRLREYSDPPLAIDLKPFELSSGARVVVLQVAEFVDTPHFCARDAGDTLRRGMLYVRATTVPETRAIATADEMRELIALSTEKQLRSMIQTTGRAGAQIVASGPDADLDNFETQRRRALE